MKMMLILVLDQVMHQSFIITAAVFGNKTETEIFLRTKSLDFVPSTSTYYRKASHGLRTF